MQLDDPVQVLTNLHTATERLTIARTDNPETSDPVIDFATIVSLVPSSVTHTGMRLYTRLGLGRWRAPRCHGSVSYIPGNTAPEYCAGAKVVGMHTAPPLLEGCGLNITVTSHNDVMDLCVCVCPRQRARGRRHRHRHAESVDLLVAAAHESPRGHGRSVVSEMRSHVKKRLHAQDSVPRIGGLRIWRGSRVVINESC